MSKITICIPTYNCEETIGAAIDSVLRNYNDNIQVLVINNASTDNTSTVIKKFKDHIHFIENDKNIGFAENYKKCIRFAKGKFITFMGGDDIIINSELLNLIDWMEQNPTVEMAGSNIRIFVDNPLKPTRHGKFGENETIYSAGSDALLNWWLPGTLASIGGWVVTSQSAKKHVDLIPAHTIIPHCYMGFDIARKFNVGYFPVEFFAQRLSNKEDQLANSMYLSITTLKDYHNLISQLKNDKNAQKNLLTQLSKMIANNLISFSAFGGKSTTIKAFRLAVALDNKIFYSPKFLFFSMLAIFLPTKLNRKLLENYRKVG